jgi:hypothetical protein
MQLFRRTLFIIAVAACASDSIAQQAPLTLKDAILKAGTDLAPERLRGLQWIEGAQRYSYVKGEQLMRGDIGKTTDRVIAELATLNKQLPDSAQLKAWPMVQWIDAVRFRFLHNQHLFVFDSAIEELKATTRIGRDAENEEVEPATNAVAFTTDNNVLVMRAGQGKNKPTRDHE